MKSGKKKKLEKFYRFTQTILPHEMQYLLSVNRLTDPDKVFILNTMASNIIEGGKLSLFPETIDKRKYSYMAQWITEKLQAADVDYFYEWLSRIDQKIMTDSISPDEEKELIKTVKSLTPNHYYFVRFYEVIQNYRYYLQIRMRYKYDEITGKFLDHFKENYQMSKLVNQRLHEATKDIVTQYSKNTTESKHWEEWLVSVFNDDNSDGLNRYFAIVRLTFLYYNYKEYGKLIELYRHLDTLIIDGKIYSRRILVNYYANRVLLHSRYNEPEKAERFGQLSIRHKGADYLHYVNSLCAVLLRNGKNAEALKLIQDSFPELRNVSSQHTRIGFVSYYIQCLNRNGKARQALSYAETFFASYKQEILQNRWHIFFTSMMRSMLILEKYPAILTLVNRYSLEPLEQQYKKRAGYIPAFIWYLAIAQYKEMKINERQLFETLMKSAMQVIHDEHKKGLILELCNELETHAPNLIQQVKKELKL